VWQYTQTTTNSQLDKRWAPYIINSIKKLDKLQVHKSHNNHNKETMKHKFSTHIVNLTQIMLSREQIQTFNLGFNYEVEKDPKKFINPLIIDTENALRHLDIKI